MNFEYIKKNYRYLSISWDIFIFAISIFNLFLIFFDFTYLSFRPFYYKNVHQITSWYDTYLGIEPHPITNKYHNLVTNLKYAKTDKEALDIQEKIYSLSEKMINNNPFEKSGLLGNFALIEQKIKRKFESETNLKANIYNVYTKIYKNVNFNNVDFNNLELNLLLLKWFWSGETKEQIKQNTLFYQQNLKFLFNSNYIRHYDINGNLVNEFYKIDLPFYFLFLTEFFIYWYISIRRKKYAFWFLFPLYRWYDVLSLIPSYYFRFFRVFRVISLFTRVRSHQFSYLGNDILSNAIVKYTNIIKDELSNMVSLRILNEFQGEIKKGKSEGLYVVEPLQKHREELKQIFFNVLQNILENDDIKEQIRLTLEKSLVDSASKVGTLKIIPNFVKQNLTKQIGLSIFDSITEVLLHLTDNKDEKMVKLMNSLFDELIFNLKNEQLNKVFHEILYGIIEKIKKNVYEKKDEKKF